MKKSIRNFLMVCLMLVCSLLFLPASRSEAAQLKQSALSETSITVSWEAQNNASNYRVYTGNDYSSQKLYTTLSADKTSVTVNGLKPGSVQYIKVEYDYRPSYNPTKIYTYLLGSGSFKTLPGKVTGVAQERWWYFAEVFDVTWDKIESADGYQYVVKTNSGKKKASGEQKYSNSLSVRKISNSVIYTVQVRAYTEISGKKYYGAWSDKAYCFTQPRITKASVSKNKLTVKWGKVAGATGYDVYVSTKKQSGYKKVASVSSKKTSVTISKLSGKKFSSKKTYYVYIATKKKAGKNTYTSGKLYFWNTKNNKSFGYFN